MSKQNILEEEGLGDVGFVQALNERDKLIAEQIFKEIEKLLGQYETFNPESKEWKQLKDKWLK